MMIFRSPAIRVSAARGAKIPQHELLSQKIWAYIKSGKVHQWTYYATTGTYKNATHAFHITIYPEDYETLEHQI